MGANIRGYWNIEHVAISSKIHNCANFFKDIQVIIPKPLSPVKLFSKNKIQNDLKSQILIEKIQSQLPLSKESLKARTNES